MEAQARGPHRPLHAGERSCQMRGGRCGAGQLGHVGAGKGMEEPGSLRLLNVSSSPAALGPSCTRRPRSGDFLGRKEPQGLRTQVPT